MKYFKLILFILIFISCLIIFKYTKKYKYENILPGNIQQQLLNNEYMNQINNNPNIHRVNKNIQNLNNNGQQNISKSNQIIDNIPYIQGSYLTERPAIKWIIKQNPLEYS